MHNQITIEELKTKTDVIYVDVRTPQEYTHAHIPGAVSLPVLNDAEHKEVSIIYTKADKDEARAMGVQYASARLPALFTKIQELTLSHDYVVMYCWRGGYRSHVLFGLLHSLSVPVYKLIGGYKEYRKFVNRSWAIALDKKPFISLYGDTGTGKTELLHALKNREASVIDLEGLAGHRGSLLGGIGLPQQPSQKMFESELQDALFSLPEGPVFIEGESRKIGDLFLPDLVYQTLKTSQKIHITSPVSQRIQRLKEEYAVYPPEEIHAAIQKLIPFIGNQAVLSLHDALKEGRVDEAIHALLINYYDPQYRHSKKEYAAELIHINTETAIEELLHVSRQLFTGAFAPGGPAPD